MNDAVKVALGLKTKGHMFASSDEFERIQSDVNSRTDEIDAAIDPDSIIVGDVRECDLDMGRTIGHVIRLDEDGHVVGASASGLHLVIECTRDDDGVEGLRINDAYPVLAEHDSGEYEPYDCLMQVMYDEDWYRLLLEDESAALVALSRAVHESPVLTDPKNGRPAYIPCPSGGRVERTHMRYHVVDADENEARTAIESMKALEFAIAAVNGTVLLLQSAEDIERAEAESNARYGFED